MPEAYVCESCGAEAKLRKKTNRASLRCLACGRPLTSMQMPPAATAPALFGILSAIGWVASILVLATTDNTNIGLICAGGISALALNLAIVAALCYLLEANMRTAMIQGFLTRRRLDAIRTDLHRMADPGTAGTKREPNGP